MADGVLWDERAVRERALALLSLADCVISEGWGDAIAAQLRQAADDLLGKAELSPPTRQSDNQTRCADRND